jgi:SAM-dependent methyltransferase
MSMGFAGLHILLPLLRSLERRPGTRMLFLGTQDLAFTYRQVEAFLTARGIPFHDVPLAERRTTNSFAHVSHTDWWQYKDFIHQETLVRMLGFSKEQLFTLDVDDYEHADIIHDLNQPIPDHFGQFDLILNQGTLEHVFDIRQALWNLSDLTRVGGQIVHMVPAAFLNHGFYNFNALLFADFYRQSGWIEEDLFYSVWPKVTIGDREIYARVLPDQLTSIPADFHVNIFARHRKTPEATKPIAVQSVYLGLHEAWNHQSRAQSRLEPPEATQPPRTNWSRRLRDRLRQAATLRRLRLFGGDVVVVQRPDGAPDQR